MKEVHKKPVDKFVEKTTIHRLRMKLRGEVAAILVVKHAKSA